MRASTFRIATMPGMKERTIILDGFSKTYAMTGWRLGYGAMPEDFAKVIGNLMVNSNSCTSMAVQIAGVEALTGPQDDVKAMVAAFEKRRDLMVDGLNDIPGISCLRPKGAFYVFPNITGTGMKSKEFADKLLQDYGVAAISGTSFGEYGEGLSAPFVCELRGKPAKGARPHPPDGHRHRCFVDQLTAKIKRAADNGRPFRHGHTRTAVPNFAMRALVGERTLPFRT